MKKGYLRVSGKGQVDGDGPERQQEAIERFCAAHGLQLDGFVFERAVSGTVSGMERPAFSELLESRPEVIIVEKLDRLARDLMVQEIALAECRKLGIKVYAADIGTLQDLASCEDDPTRKLLRQFLGAIAEWNKSNIVSMLGAARRRKRETTGRCEGAKPYGELSGEKFVLETMLERFADTQCYGDVAEHLNLVGMATRSGKKWHRTTVFKILRRFRDEINERIARIGPKETGTEPVLWEKTESGAVLPRGDCGYAGRPAAKLYGPSLLVETAEKPSEFSI